MKNIDTRTIWKNNAPLCEVDSKQSLLKWQAAGLSFTVSGYGKRIPTPTMVRYQGKWRRVYVCCFSNSGTAYIGKWITGQGAELTVTN